MSQSVVSFRLDSDVKKNMEQVCDELGLSMSAAFAVFAKTVARERRIPFELTADPFYSISNLAHLRASIDQLEQGQLVTKTMEELEAMADA